MRLPLAILGLDVTGYLSGHWWAYLIVFGACTLDSILFFLVPSEAVTIAAGVLAAQGRLAIWWVAAAAAVGVFAGDNAMYWIGRLASEPITRWICRYDRGRRWLEQGHGLIHRNGEVVILAGRFIPAGRSAATLASGIAELSWPRFAAADAGAAVVWAAYASMLGYLGGQAWQNSFWKPFVVGLGVAVVVGGGGELWRRYERRHGKDVLGQELGEDDGADEPVSRGRDREREETRAGRS
jgi:membrane-associated protein